MELEIDFKMSEEEQGLYEADLRKLADKTVAVLQDAKSPGLSKNFGKVEKGILEFGFLDDEEMQKLNKQYRQKDQTTDVLSFSYLDGEKFPGDNLIGQIFISPTVADKQARENGWSVREEVDFLFVHGLLHVFGFDHLKREEFEEMFKWQMKIQPETTETIAKIREGTVWSEEN